LLDLLEVQQANARQQRFPKPYFELLQVGTSGTRQHVLQRLGTTMRVHGQQVVFITAKRASSMV